MSDQSRAASAAMPTETAAVSGLLAVVRHDLFRDAFAARPLPPRAEPRADGPLRRLPAGVRSRLRWTPHVLMVALSALVFLIGVGKNPDVSSVYALVPLVLCFLNAAPIALTLVRPVGAYWISYGGLLLSLLYDDLWAALGLLCHLLVMVVVVLRTRPRLAGEMWAVSFGSGLLLTAVLLPSQRALPQVAAVSAVVLVAAAAVVAWRQERQHVVETESDKERERAQRTVLEERAIIARELHDVVAHHMSVIAIQAEAAPYRVAQTPPELATSFATIRENAVAALAELRRILGVVRSGEPDPFGDTAPEAPQPTLADLDALIESVRATGLEAEAVVIGAVRPLPQGVELSAYRLVQEALSNALRHSPGAPARVEVAYVLGGLGLRVVNGRPERPATPSPGAGHGVLGMRERVQVLGGAMTAGPTEDGGYEVSAFLPVEPPGEAEAGAGGASGAIGASGAGDVSGAGGASGPGGASSTAGATGAGGTSGPGDASSTAGVTGAGGAPDAPVPGPDGASSAAGTTTASAATAPPERPGTPDRPGTSGRPGKSDEPAPGGTSGESPTVRLGKDAGPGKEGVA
ncbi:sensor histidine kinase [Streptomyces albus]|uniref:sensor histidine kinase n=1 Tax=Streptomyces TaxID=1883 RepID=UPI0024E16C7B|nr:histidine kinase [Streptomyces albus]